MKLDAIIADNLTLAYDGKYAARGLSFKVEEGSIVGVLGQEGSGKTTLIKLINGIVEPESGYSSVFGHLSYEESEKIHAISGVVIDSAQLYDAMTPVENLSFFGKINGLSEANIMDRTSFLLRAFDVWHSRDLPLYKLTTDEKRRLSIARSLIGNPKVLFLDEPTKGFDIQSVEYTNSAIRDIAEKEGITVLAASDEAEDLNFCNTFVILADGENIAEGTIKQLQARVQLKNRAVIKVAEGDLSSPGLEMKKVAENTFEKGIDKDSDMAEIIRKAVFWGKDIIEATIIKPTLTDIYEELLARREKNSCLPEQAE